MLYFDNRHKIVIQPHLIEAFLKENQRRLHCIELRLQDFVKQYRSN